MLILVLGLPVRNRMTFGNFLAFINSLSSSIKWEQQYLCINWLQFSSVQSLSCLTLCDPMIAARQASLSITTPGVYSNSCPSSRWCHPAISSSVVPFSSCPQSLPASGSFPTSQLFAWDGQSTGASASASVLPMNTQDWSPLEWTAWISLQLLTYP